MYEEECGEVFTTHVSAGYRDEIACKFNIGIDCPTVQRNCWECGWNPKVDAKRKEELRKIYGEKQGGKDVQ